jgi:UDP-N-acetyl-D-mannosaminuronic acid dehydrogenase
MTFQTVSVIGLGYIGLPTAAVMAERGVNVVGVDVNAHAVETVNRGDIHIVEPLLDLTVKAAVTSGRLRAVTKPEPADAFLIAVPTPITEGKCADLSYVMAAAVAIAPVLKRGDLVILESTSPVGATETLAARLASERPDLRFPDRGDDGATIDVNVAYCPERVLPGHVVKELVSNDRAIGGMTPACTQRAIALYSLFVEGELVPTDVRSAELCKLAENAFRDVNIAYANELANVCDALDMNVWEVIRLANRHPRVNILSPGPGVGGHCIAVDPWFIAEAAPDDTPVIQAARRVNDGRPQRVIDKVLAAIAAHPKQSAATVACLGLAFKANIDDLRESPAMAVAIGLAEQAGNPLLMVEPNVTALPKKLAGGASRLIDLEAAMQTADIVVLLVDHREFLAMDPAIPARCVVIDTRGVWG